MSSLTIPHPFYPYARRAVVTEDRRSGLQVVDVLYRRPNGQWQKVETTIEDSPLHLARDAAYRRLVEEHTP